VIRRPNEAPEGATAQNSPRPRRELSITLVALGSLAVVAATAQAAPSTITGVAGDGTFGYGGDNGPATSAKLALPTAISPTSDGFLIADSDNSRMGGLVPQGEDHRAPQAQTQVPWEECPPDVRLPLEPDPIDVRVQARSWRLPSVSHTKELQCSSRRAHLQSQGGQPVLLHRARRCVPLQDRSQAVARGTRPTHSCFCRLSSCVRGELPKAS
jgi:hypothetical protein